MKLTFVTAVLAASIAFSAFADMPFGEGFGDKDVNQGVRCHVKTVDVLAKNEADCKTVGGEVVTETHTHTEPSKK